MKRFPLLLAVLVLVAGCSDDSDTAPAPNDNRPEFTASLLPSNEVPPITDAEASGSGTAVIHLNLTRDAAGAITAATADFTVELSGFPPSTNITIAHIHVGAAGVNGGIQINTGINNDVPLTNGAGTFTRNGVSGFNASVAQAIINNPAGYYFNVHSSAHPAGVIRGQLVRK